MNPMSEVVIYMLIEAFSRARGHGEIYVNYLHRTLGEVRRILNAKASKNPSLNHLRMPESDEPGFFPALNKELKEWKRAGLVDIYYEREQEIIRLMPGGEQALNTKALEVSSRLSHGDHQVLTTIVNEAVRLYQSMMSRERRGCDM